MVSELATFYTDTKLRNEMTEEKQVTAQPVIHSITQYTNNEAGGNFFLPKVEIKKGNTIRESENLH